MKTYQQIPILFLITLLCSQSSWGSVTVYLRNDSEQRTDDLYVESAWVTANNKTRGTSVDLLESGRSLGKGATATGKINFDPLSLTVHVQYHWKERGDDHYCRVSKVGELKDQNIVTFYLKDFLNTSSCANRPPIHN